MQFKVFVVKTEYVQIKMRFLIFLVTIFNKSAILWFLKKKKIIPIKIKFSIFKKKRNKKAIFSFLLNK